MAVTRLKDAFPRMSIIEKQYRCLKQVAFGMMPMIVEAMNVRQDNPQQEKG